MKYLSLRKRALLLFLSVLTAACATMAAPRSVQQAQQEAQQLMSKQAVRKAGSRQFVAATTPQLVFTQAKKNAADGAYYYVFSAGENRGFTIVAGDDRLPAIVGYTESGDYDADQLPDNFVSFMQAYQDFVEHATDEELEKVSRWKTISAAHEPIAPIIKSKWDQGAPYNNMCPTYIGTSKAATGCLATAIAQILYYHKHPVSLQADIPSYRTTSYRISMEEVAAGEEYDWNNMLDTYNGSATTAQQDAVAKLMLHAGCAVQMDYGPSSGASPSSETFTKYFGMDKELTRLLMRSSYDLPEWDDLLYREMAESRPVLYSGQSTGGGHAFVIHGYDDGLYCVNWGWSGMCDGYFDVTILNPDNTTGAGASSSSDGYSMQNAMIIGIQPDNGVVDNVPTTYTTSVTNLRFAGAYVSGNTLSSDIYISPMNNSLTEGSAFVSVGYMGNDGNIVKVANNFELKSSACPIGYYYENQRLSLSLQFEENKTYRLYAIESLDGFDWALSGSAKKTALTFMVQNGTVVNITEEAVLSATATLDTKNSGGYAGMSNSINVTVKNTGDKEYYSPVHVFVNKGTYMPSRAFYSTGITAAVGDSTTFNFAYTPVSEGTYTFWVLDDNYNEIGQSTIEFLPSTAPILSFVSITCSNASGEKILTSYNGYSNVEMDKVNDTKASFTFEIKNEGGYYQGQFAVYELDAVSNKWSGYLQQLTIPANTTTSFTFDAEGSAGDVVGIWLQSYNSAVSIQGLPTDMQKRHEVYQDGRYIGSFNFTDHEIAYLAGPDTSVGSVKAADGSLSVKGGRGCIMLKAEAGTDVSIVNIGGAQVAHLKLAAGEQTTVSVPAGIYVVNKTKVVVR